MGKLKQYHNSAWETRAQGSGSSGGGGTSFDTDFAIKMSAATTCANTVLTKILFDTLIIDTNSEWDSTNKYWVCGTTGTYIVNASIQWDTNGTSYRSIHVYVDGATVQTRSYGTPLSTANTNIPITYKLSLTAGQYVEIYGRQGSGGALDAVVGVPAVEWQVWRINGSGSGGGSSTFVGLTDTPSAFTGQAGKVATVNTGETALEFATPSSGGSADGWTTVSDTLTYASATTFTVPTDLTATYQKGTKLKLTNVTVKYFYVVSSTYGAPNTTVTVTGGDDYALASAAITAPYYSYIENPQGFPDWFNYTPTLSALGPMTVSSPVITLAIFKISGRQVFVNLRCGFTLGGTAGSSVYATVPVECAAGQSSGQATCLSGAISEGGFVIYGYGAPGDYLKIRRYNSGDWATGENKLFTASVNYQMD